MTAARFSRADAGRHVYPLIDAEKYQRSAAPTRRAFGCRTSRSAAARAGADSRFRAKWRRRLHGNSGLMHQHAQDDADFIRLRATGSADYRLERGDGANLLHARYWRSRRQSERFQEERHGLR